MTKATVADWDTTAANNTDIADINIAENCPAQNINNAIRTVMAQIKTWSNTLIQTIATASNLWALSSNSVIVTPKSLGDAVALTVLTDAATITIDQAAGINFKVTLGGTRVLANMTNAVPGTSGVIIIRQDGAGSRALTFGDHYVLMGGVTALNPVAGSVSLISYIVESSTSILLFVSKS
jgi:predicted regulator of Ras-like GTPase activity (Roadblock/LC7/MglB family)